VVVAVLTAPDYDLATLPAAPLHQDGEREDAMGEARRPDCEDCGASLTGDRDARQCVWCATWLHDDCRCSCREAVCNRSAL
jgi:hypothetical protein